MRCGFNKQIPDLARSLDSIVKNSKETFIDHSAQPAPRHLSGK